MTRQFPCYLVLAGLLATHGLLRADTTPQSGPAPEFKEVYDLLRANLPEATDENLNRAAIEGLLSRFHGRISLVNGAANGPVPPGGAALSRSMILENDVAYLRAARVAGNLANELDAAYRALTATNKVAGAILDLRFADGDDFAASQAAADLFTSKKTIAGPVVVLVNSRTRGAAGTLASVLRDAGAGLIIGSPTSGEAAAFKEFPLHNGERLLIATTASKSDNKSAMSSGSLQPDIIVTASADDERGFIENPYVLPARTNRNPDGVTSNLQSLVDHTSEADLVREKQKADLERGRPVEKPVPAWTAEPQKPAIRDPVLARAVDLIKGLTIVRKPHS